MAKIKKISELEQLSSLSSSSNIIIEENGQAKRIAASKLVVGGNGDGGSSVQPDWNQNDSTQPDYVKNRTHWEENNQTTIEWHDSDTDGRDIFTIGYATMVKVSDVVPDPDEMVGATLRLDTSEGSTEIVISEADVMTADGCYILWGVVLVAQRTDIVYGDYSAVAPSTGIYMMDADANATISLTYGSVTVHRIDPKFLPEGGFGYEEGSQTVIEWDGNADGRDSVVFSGTTFYKIGDLIPSKDELIGAVLRRSLGSEVKEEVLTGDYLVEGDGLLIVAGLLLVFTETAGSYDGMTVNAPSTGCYAVKIPEADIRFVSVSYGSSTIHQLDEKFIPDTIARTKDVPEVNYPVTSVNGMTGDVVIEIGGSGSSVNPDWNQNDPAQPDYVKNRTHWEENNKVTIEWDGSTEGRDSGALDGSEGGYYKVSDLILTKEDVLGGTIHCIFESAPVEQVLTEDLVVEGDGVLIVGDLLVVFTKTTGTYDEMTIEVPSTGCYAAYVPQLNARFVSLTYGSVAVHKLDPKFLPEGGFGWEDGSHAVIEWDGNTEGRENFQFGANVASYKISDLTPTVGELIGGKYVITGGSAAGEHTIDESVCSSEGGVIAITIAEFMSLLICHEEWNGLTPGIYAGAAFDGDAGVGELKMYVSKLTYGSAIIHKIDPKFLPEMPGGVTSWNDLTDRPFFEENGQIVIAWDGDTAGREQLSINGALQGACKVSDLAPSEEEVIGGSFTESTGMTTQIFQHSVDSGAGYMWLGNQIIVCYKTEFTYGLMQYSCPSPGIYMFKDDYGNHISNLTYSGTVVHKLDDKFIPDSVARKSDIASSSCGLPMPETAAVGQFIVVSAVDENGKVTATRAVDATELSTMLSAEEVKF